MARDKAPFRTSPGAHVKVRTSGLGPPCRYQVPEHGRRDVVLLEGGLSAYSRLLCPSSVSSATSFAVVVLAEAGGRGRRSVGT